MNADDGDDDDDDDDVVVIPENVIDKDSALNIVLGHAGVALEDATDIHVDFDDDDFARIMSESFNSIKEESNFLDVSFLP